MRPPKRSTRKDGSLSEPVYDGEAYRAMRRAAGRPEYWPVVLRELRHLSEQRVACGYPPIDLSDWPDA